MLSRMADNLFWFGRYVQRAENTARLASVHANLILDMPRRAVVAWESVVDITGSRSGFVERYDGFTETNVVRFLLVDEANPGSILASLAQARTILRAARDVMPREVWEEINKLYWFVRDTDASTLERRKRGEFLDTVIRGCLLVDGMIGENMSHDLAFRFLRLGSNLEQADMTSRIVDASALGLLPPRDDELLPFSNIQWRSVLLSLTAYQMYRRHVRKRVSGPKVVQFLTQNRDFPRSIAWNLDSICHTLARLPNHVSPLNVARTLRARVCGADLTVLPQSQVSDYMDELQAKLAELSNVITEHYFRPELAPDAMSQSQ
ncbi:alpha-E domain-containing protein [uncultured Abyssibacter sp.]|uniref:alpha-E domain-containing protein n=1 Tax=uncultured Abyssibacter sp. TaxID=2320202 RepID=UPI0032B0FBA3